MEPREERGLLTQTPSEKEVTGEGTVSHTHLRGDTESGGTTTTEAGGVAGRHGRRQSKDPRSLLWPQLDWRALSVPRVPIRWRPHPSVWTPRPGWLLLIGLSSPEGRRREDSFVWAGSVPQILLLANFLIPLTYRVKEGMTRDFSPLLYGG